MKTVDSHVPELSEQLQLSKQFRQLHQTVRSAIGGAATLQDTLWATSRRVASYAARREVKEILSAIGDPRRLEHYGKKVYSQNEEDGIIDEIFKRIGITPDSGYFIEIGAGNGLENNTLCLLLRGFSGMWVEASESCQVRERFKSLIDGQRLCIEQAFVTAANADQLVQSFTRGKKDISLLSIDIDGNDLWVWDSISSIEPAVVVIEYNARFPPPLSVAAEYRPDFRWRGTDYFGASLSALVRVGNRKKFRLVGCNITGSNAFFVRADLVQDRFPYSLTPENLYHPCRYHLTTDAFAASATPPTLDHTSR